MTLNNQYGENPEGQFIEEPDDDQPLRPKSILSPPNYNSRVVKFRLIMLTALLLATVFLMKEVGNEKYWKWIVPDPPVKLAKNGEIAQTPSVSQPPPTLGAPSDKPFASVDSKMSQAEAELTTASKRSANASGGHSIEPAEPTPHIPTNSNEFPIAAAEFWRTTVRKMSPQQQQTLFRFLKGLRTSQPLKDPAEPELEQLVTRIKQLRKKFHREMLDQLPLLADGNPEKTKIANELYESEQIWSRKILPAFQAVLAGEEITVSQQRQIQVLQKILDPVFLESVQDETSLGWEGDSAAWLRLWERVFETAWQNPETATHLQLVSQPKFYRGKAIVIEGWVRSARRKQLIDSELGIPYYYELWVRPADSNVTPYCVYSLQLPQDFPTVSDQFSELNERIQVAGLFFKIRTFVDGASKVSHSPVILAKRFDTIADPANLPTAVMAWRPSLTTWITFLLLIPLVAAGIAWLIFRTSETRRYQPGVLTTEKIQQTLHRLADDPDVKTDADRIKELYPAETEDNV